LHRKPRRNHMLPTQESFVRYRVNQALRCNRRDSKRGKLKPPAENGDILASGERQLSITVRTNTNLFDRAVWIHTFKLYLRRDVIRLRPAQRRK